MGIAYPTPLYIQYIDIANNRVVVGDNDALFKDELVADHINWIAVPPQKEIFEAEVKIRYLHKASPAIVHPLTDSRVHIIFKDKQRAITPGQSVVFYNGDILLGGGLIA